MKEEQIIYLTAQLRQAEILRNETKNVAQKQAMTARIHNLKAELDPLLNAYIAEKKKAKMTVDKSNEDIGPKEIVDALHGFARVRISDKDFVNSLDSGPVSVAGSHVGVSYVLHFQRTSTL